MRLRDRVLTLPTPRLLVVTAVEAERAAIHSGLTLAGDGDRWSITVLVGGVGPAQAAASTAIELARAGDYAAVVSAGIGGGVKGTAEPGTVVLGLISIAADLGADSPDGFLSLDDLGFGSSTVECDPDLVAMLRAAIPEAVAGAVLTVSTVTGRTERAVELRERYPSAVAEAMEGFGVGTAAVQLGVPFAEVRTISNEIGPRDRAAWRIGDALAALERVGSALARC